MLVAAIAAAMTVTVLSAGSALADVSSYNRLRTEVYTCTDGTTCSTYIDPATDGAYARWQTLSKNGEDSPLDADARALMVHTPANDQAGNYDVAEVYTNHSLNLNLAASAVKNLSFDAYKPALQGGSPRIDVFFQNPLTDGSTYVAIDAGNCQKTLSSTWVRADATGQTAPGCTIYTSNGTAYSSDGTNSAWANLVAANPNAVVAYDFMVFDQPTGNTNTDYRIDRISLGTGKMFTRSNFSAVSCTSEAAC
jgi:hypothetical protein